MIVNKLLLCIVASGNTYIQCAAVFVARGLPINKHVASQSQTGALLLPLRFGIARFLGVWTAARFTCFIIQTNSTKMFRLFLNVATN